MHVRILLSSVQVICDIRYLLAAELDSSDSGCIPVRTRQFYESLGAPITGEEEEPGKSTEKTFCDTYFLL